MKLVPHWPSEPQVVALCHRDFEGQVLEVMVSRVGCDLSQQWWKRWKDLRFREKHPRGQHQRDESHHPRPKTFGRGDTWAVGGGDKQRVVVWVKPMPEFMFWGNWSLKKNSVGRSAKIKNLRKCSINHGRRIYFGLKSSFGILFLNL